MWKFHWVSRCDVWKLIIFSPWVILWQRRVDFCECKTIGLLCNWYKAILKSIKVLQVVIYEFSWHTFWPQSSKIFPKKRFLYFLKKNVFLIFWEIELFGPKIKNFFIFSEKRFFLHFWKGNFLPLRLKKIVILSDLRSQIVLKNPLWKNFLYFFQKEVFLIIREIKLSYIFSKKGFSCILGNGTFWP